MSGPGEHAHTHASERSFGLLFGLVFLLIGAWPLLSGNLPHWSMALLAALFFAAALLQPALLRPLCRLWLLLGHLLHHITNPVIMALIYVLTILPLGLWFRLTGRDPLRLKRDDTAASYWIRRNPPGPAADSMSNQF